MIFVKKTSTGGCRNAVYKCRQNRSWNGVTRTMDAGVARTEDASVQSSNGGARVELLKTMEPRSCEDQLI